MVIFDRKWAKILHDSEKFYLELGNFCIFDVMKINDDRKCCTRLTFKNQTHLKNSVNSH